MMQHLQRALADLPCDVGVTEPDGSRTSDGRTGYLSYGPYIALPAGRYFGGFHVRRTGPGVPGAELSLDASCGAAGVVGNRGIPLTDLHADIAGLVGFEFTVLAPCTSFELRLHATSDARVNVTEMKLFRL